ncbi:MAG: Ldh family oxidoreductase [Solirubrobacteraceae bacterium]
MAQSVASPKSQVVLVPAESLWEFCESAARAAGFSQSDARDLTAALVGASLRSLPGQGQGVQSLPKYVGRVRSGLIDARAEITEVAGRGATRLLDARRAHGGVAATRAMRLALDLASTHGIGAVGVRNSTHLGAAGYFAELATERGCIGMVFTNAGPEIAPWGATEVVVGTNPWAVAVPSRQGWPVVLDMANSTSGKGMVRWNQLIGSPIPDDWALTVDGQRTTDPAAALAGTLFPLGGPKGYAMAVMVDLLTGALTGSAVGTDCFGDDHQNVGHLVLAVSIEAFGALNEFLDRVELLIAQIRSSPPAGPDTRILLPGELEHERRAERTASGVPIPVERFDGLLEMASVLELDRQLTERLEALR